ncbi:hypothetical protein [Natrarchaeobius chitinivorans]|uniref:DUF8108 domain-containing protein n=1 Tax=Natrarchaeobius chitinivorans TaxID=1679083 RepID=A0A3N6P7M3_NATCH|nr:hypothetical protein [Natrarchaeobius chitinivorans]RQG91965.1 hypothetical protein EA473_18205 [Natrarchaeobius chitinivorans]
MSESTPGVVELADDISALLYGIAGWLSIGFGVLLAGSAVLNLILAGLALSGASAVFAAMMLIVAFVFIALGAFVNPRTRRRLNRRHEPSKFGRVHSVDQRVIRADEGCSERCVGCGCRVEEGLLRRYREEFALAGIPVYTTDVGYNHYCLECATEEVLGTRPDTAAGRRADEYAERELSLERE